MIHGGRTPLARVVAAADRVVVSYRLVRMRRTWSSSKAGPHSSLHRGRPQSPTDDSFIGQASSLSTAPQCVEVSPLTDFDHGAYARTLYKRPTQVATSTATPPPAPPWAGRRAKSGGVMNNTGPEPGRRLVKSWLRVLETQKLLKVVELLERFASSKYSVGKTVMLQQFGGLLKQNPEIVYQFECFIQGTGLGESFGGGDVHGEQDASVAEARTPLADADRDQLAALLLQCRRSAPTIMGTYSAPSEHLKLHRILVFGALVEAVDLPARGADLLETEESGAELPAQASPGGRGEHAPLSEEGCRERSAAVQAATALADKLALDLPPRVLASLRRHLETLDEKQVKRTVGPCASPVLRTESVERVLQQRRKAMKKCTRILSHYWPGTGPELCRFLRVYDTSAAEACPFNTELGELAKNLEKQLLLPLLLARGKVLTPLLKVSSDGGHTSATGDGAVASPDALSLQAAARMHQELVKSGAHIEASEKIATGSRSTLYESTARHLVLSTRAHFSSDEAVAELMSEAAAQAALSRAHRTSPEKGAVAACSRSDKGETGKGSCLPRPPDMAPASWDAKRTIVIRNLPEEVTRDDLAWALRRCGVVDAVCLFNQRAPSGEETGASADGGEGGAIEYEAAAAEAKRRAKAAEAAEAAEEVGMTRQQLRQLRAERKQVKSASIEAARVAKAEVRAAAKANKAAERAASRAAKSTVGRKAGVKSLVAAKAVAMRRESDVYAFVEFERQADAEKASSHDVRIFGVKIGDRVCPTMPATEVRRFEAHVLTGEAHRSELHDFLNRTLAPQLHLAGRSSALIDDTTPNRVSVSFDCHEAAMWAWRRLGERGVTLQERGGHLPSVAFGMQWLRVRDSTLRAMVNDAEAAKAKTTAANRNAELEEKGFFVPLDHELQLRIGPVAEPGPFNK